MTSVRILIVDDHEPVRRGMRSLLSSRAQWSVCGEAQNGIEAVAQARALRPDIVLLDVSMPMMDGVSAAEILRREVPESRVIIISQNDRATVRRQAAEVHAAGYLSKADISLGLLTAVENALVTKAESKPALERHAGTPSLYPATVGGGVLGQLIQRHDWAQTPLGPIENWPQSLKTSVDLMLNSQHPMWIGWGPDATFLYNDAYIQVLSLAKHPWALGRPAAQVWTEIWNICGPLADKVFQKGEASFVDEVRLFMNRGDYLEETYYSFSYSPIRDEFGNVAGLFCPSTEVTPKVLNTRRLRTLSELSANALLQKTMDAACASASMILARNPDDVPFAVLYLVDSSGNRASLEQTSGIARGVPMVSPSAVNLVNPASEPTVWPIAEVVRSEKWRVVPVKEVAGLPLGPAKQHLSEAFALPLISQGGDRPLGVLIAGVNPTRKLDPEYQTFYELVALQVATAIQNARTAEEERRRIEALAEINRTKTAFFSNVSHELRTPLTLILGPVEDLLQKQSDLSPSVKNQLEMVERNGARLLRLVNTLLDFSRIEAGRMEAVYEETDLAALTLELANAFGSVTERAGLSLELDCPQLSSKVFVDHDMWEKIVLNLLSNAFKFTFHGGIAVSLRETADAVELRVRDTGVGIADHELPRLFERFHRVENTRSRTHEGSGIGLALVDDLVKRHGGTVRVESRVGEGSTFIVTIPRGKDHLPADRIGGTRSLESTAVGAAPFLEEAMRWLPDPEVHSAVVPPSSEVLTALEPVLDFAVPFPVKESTGSRRPHILVADDNADMRQYLLQLLSEHYEVQSVPDGRAALEAVRLQAPDLVLADVMMPNVDGFRLLNELRSDPGTKTLPIILLSARASEDARVEGMQQFADDYVVKPFAARELLARVETHLRMARVRAEAAELEKRLRLQADLERNRLRESFTLAPAAMALLSGPDHRFTFVNAAFVELAGRTSFDEILHRTVRDAFPDLARQGLDKILDQVYQTGEPFAVEEREIRLMSNGREKTKYVSFSCHLMRDADDSLNAVLIHAVDATEQVLARNQLEARVKERTAELSEAEIRLRILSNRLMRAQDHERRRLARELHDSAGQMLAALKMNLVPLEQRLAQSPQLGEFANNSIRLVDELSKELRTMSYLLHPPLLDEAGLPSALRWYVEGFSERSGIAVTLTIDPALPRVAQEVEMTIFRIVQESLTNIHRHSGSKAASINVIHDSVKIRVEIQDKGKGIAQLNSMNNLPMRVGVGIQGMQERVRQFNGQFEIRSGENGTKVVVVLPSQPDAPDTEEPARAEVA